MIKWLLGILMLGSINLCAQFTIDFRPIEGDVVSVVTLSKAKKSKDRGNKITAFYGAHNFVLSESAVLAGDTTHYFKFEYDLSDSLKREVRIISGGSRMSRVVEFRNENGHLELVDFYWTHDTITPLHQDHSFIYNKNKLVSYSRTRNNNAFRVAKEGDKTRETCFEFQYSDEYLVRENEYDSCSAIGKQTTYTYDELGNIETETITGKDSNEHIFGGKSKDGVQRFLYKYDKQGNWIRRYFLHENGRKTLEIKRRITYR